MLEHLWQRMLDRRQHLSYVVLVACCCRKLTLQFLAALPRVRQSRAVHHLLAFLLRTHFSSPARPVQLNDIEEATSEHSYTDHCSARHSFSECSSEPCSQSGASVPVARKCHEVPLYDQTSTLQHLFRDSHLGRVHQEHSNNSDCFC